MTFYLVLAALVAALAVALWLFQRGHSKPLPATPPAQSGPPPTLVEAAKVMVDTIPVGITAVGSLRSDETVMLRPEIAGRVSRVLFREGQPVARGQVLIQLDGAVQGAEVQQAQANVTLAQSKLDRARDLQAKGFISQQARDESDNNLRLAQAALSLAQARYAKTEIRAPFNGVAGLRVVSTGDYVKEGQDLVNLEAMDVLKVDFRIPEIYVQQSKVGQSLQLVLDAMPGQTFTGQVIAINPLIDANGRSIVLRAQVQNAQHQLRPGLFARVRLLFADQKEALLVSEQALIPQGDDHMVFRVINGKAVLSRVEIGQRIGERVEVVQGLTKDDMVITAGQVKLRDGMAVTVKQ
ncbi:MAG: efflux RND transporter periplasmic adaptor subunit [Burkholderiaceae bacterium]|nr:MAG: efflux RND transporter periplasmic adaptor subunit [Burkholderiaceae bacterium]